MKNEEHDELWALLARARQPKPRPFFASKVIRAVEAGASEKPGLLSWVYLRWVVPAAAVAIAVFIAVWAADRPAMRETNPVAVTADPLQEMAEAAASTPEFSSLDSLLAAEDHSIWLAADPSPLF